MHDTVGYYGLVRYTGSHACPTDFSIKNSAFARAVHQEETIEMIDRLIAHAINVSPRRG